MKTLCEKCGQYAATVFWEETVNGKKHSVALCPHCAAESGLGGELFSFPLFSFQKGREPESACPGCGMTEREIRKTGQFGCSRCYDVFGPHFDFTPFLGKGYKEKAKEEQKEPDELHQLRAALQEALKKEDYEQAAVLRDRIRAKEGA